MPNLLSFKKMENFFVPRNRLFRAFPEALRGMFVAVPYRIVIHRLQDTHKLTLPLLAGIEEIHHATAKLLLCSRSIEIR